METSLFTALGGVCGFLFGSSLMHVATKGNKGIAVVYGVICFFLWAFLAFIIRQ